MRTTTKQQDLIYTNVNIKEINHKHFICQK